MTDQTKRALERLPKGDGQPVEHAVIAKSALAARSTALLEMLDKLLFTRSQYGHYSQEFNRLLDEAEALLRETPRAMLETPEHCADGDPSFLEWSDCAQCRKKPAK